MTITWFPTLEMLEGALKNHVRKSESPPYMLKAVVDSYKCENAR